MKAADWFAGSGGAPRGFTKVGQEPLVLVLERGGRKIGLVFFAAPPAVENSPPALIENIFSQAIKAGKKIKPSVGLLIGVSPWGQRLEDDFLARGNGLFDILLGGGDGIGFPAYVRKEAPQLLWARSDINGRAVTVLDLFAWPEPLAPGAPASADWVEGVTFKSTQPVLSQSLPPDSEISPLLESLPDTAP